MKKVLLVGLVIALCIMTSAMLASASIVMLDFEGLGDRAPVGDFYNGGGGTDYGIEFSTHTLAVIDRDAGGTGNFGGEPSPDTIMFFLEGSEAMMNFATGFDVGFSFYYTAINNPGSLKVYDNVWGAGNVLANLILGLTPNNGAPDPNGTFSPLIPLGVAFDGLAKSVSFAGVANQIGFDNVTFGTDNPRPPVPEPSTFLLFSAGLVGLVCYRRKRKKV